MSYKIIEKDPNAVLDFGVRWTKWLDTDTISASTWIVPTGLTADSDSFTDTVTTVWLSGGVDGSSYDIVNRITTAAGRVDDRTIRISVVEK
jgi:hypothetical protein